jgi:hypothetical protein
MSLITNEVIGIENLSSFENAGNTEIVLTNSGQNEKKLIDLLVEKMKPNLRQ